MGVEGEEEEEEEEEEVRWRREKGLDGPFDPLEVGGKVMGVQWRMVPVKGGVKGEDEEEEEEEAVDKSPTSARPTASSVPL